MDSAKLVNFRSSLSNFLKQDRGSCLFLFLVGLTLRGIPELLVSWYPIGYETITWYAPPMMAFPGRSLVDVFLEFFKSGPLFYLLMWLVINATGAHAFVILKIAGPLLYGGLLVSFFVLLKHGLKLEWKMAFLSALLLAFQVVALREAWDRFLTMLGLIFLFCALTVVKGTRRFKYWIVAFLAVLTALSREYIALVLFITVLGFAILEKKSRVKSLAALVPAFVLFLLITYFSSLPSYYPLGVRFTWPIYSGLVTDIILIFIFGYALLLPLVVKGFARETLLDPMVAWLLLGSFSSVVAPWAAIPGYQRWLMLFVYPFSAYGVIGLKRLRLFDERRKAFWVLLLIFMLFGAGYSTGKLSYVGFNSYIPANMVQSSIGWDQVSDVIKCLNWLDAHAMSNSSIITEERFYGWTRIYLERANDDVRVTVYGASSSPQPALEKELGYGSKWIYLIWYSNANFDDFQAVHIENGISVFQYVPRTSNL